MNPLFTVIVFVLAGLAIVDLIVGVANDAVNFLNSAMGSRITKRNIILTVAAIGIMVGVLTSSGMMEVARSGVFHPSMFTFKEVMFLFLGMMVGDIILLDIFNSLGLPTSTTVSLVFGLLGSALAVALHSIYFNPEVNIAQIAQYINTGKAMAIISAILLSVVLAFFFGMIFMYISRLIFSFRYHKIFKKAGALWCGISITGIIYFALFKGLKSSGIVPEQLTDWIHTNTGLALLIIWIGSSIILQVLQLLKVNILKITILSGTFALALAFAGNDLVNFIGVPLAGIESYQTALDAGTTDIMMESLNAPSKAPHWILAIAGGVMVLTLFFNKKAMRVTQTELSLSSQNEGNEHFDSSRLSRGLVGAAVNLNNFWKHITSPTLRERIDRRFQPLSSQERSEASYDLIRATVNLTAASILISLATSLKLPLSTTYVVFMVAMGSSLADRAWGRDSAVYRITGVFTVIAGWFITAIAAFTLEFAITSILIWGGTPAVIFVLIVCAAVMVHSNFKKKKKSKQGIIARIEDLPADSSASQALRVCNRKTKEKLQQTLGIYNRCLSALYKENRKLLRILYQESKEMMDQARKEKYSMMQQVRMLQDFGVSNPYFYVQVTDYLSEVSKALYHIVSPAYEHIDNHHQKFSTFQEKDLKRVNDMVEAVFRMGMDMLDSSNYSRLEEMLEMRDRLFDVITDILKEQWQRLSPGDGSTPETVSARANVLFLEILSETKTMMLQTRNVIKSQRELEAKF